MDPEQPPTPVMIALMVVGFLMVMAFMFLNYRCNELQRRNGKIVKALKHLNAKAMAADDSAGHTPDDADTQDDSV